MLNALESIRSNPTTISFEIGELLFAQFSCPGTEPVGVWTQTDYLIHVVSGVMTWKDHAGTWSTEAGQTVYFKKGVKIIPEHSASLLQTTGMSVTEIMFECGFEDLSHFSRAFKDRFGQSPSTFREKGSLFLMQNY